MKILFTKRFEHKDSSGRTIYPSGAELPVTAEVAIAAAIDGCTDDPLALEMAESTGAKKAANKAIDKMTAKDLKAELKRVMAGEPDKAQAAQIADLTAKLEAATQAKEVAEGKVTTLEADAKAVIDAHNNGFDVEDMKVETLADLAALITLAAEETQDDNQGGQKTA